MATMALTPLRKLLELNFRSIAMAHVLPVLLETARAMRTLI